MPTKRTRTPRLSRLGPEAIAWAASDDAKRFFESDIYPYHDGAIQNLPGVKPWWNSLRLVWRSKVEQFLKKMGYRLVLRELSHPAEAKAGGPLVLQSRWENVGVAPVYRPWPLAYRLRNESEQVMAQWTSGADLKRWLPGERYQVEDAPTIPPDLPAGVYHVDVAVLDETGRSALVDLAIAGWRADRWYPISRVSVRK